MPSIPAPGLVGHGVLSFFRFDTPLPRLIYILTHIPFPFYKGWVCVCVSREAGSDPALVARFTQSIGHRKTWRAVRWFGTQSALRAAKERVTGEVLADLECVPNGDAKVPNGERTVPIRDPDNNKQQQVLLWKRASRLRTAGVRAPRWGRLRLKWRGDPSR